MPDADNNYFVDILGFNETERRLLASIFGLAARHDPSFRQRDPASKAPVDLYLVDADNLEAMKVFQLVQARNPAPAVLIGNSDHGTGLLLLGRPIQWARLLQAFGETILDGVQQGSPYPAHNAGAADPADHDKTLVLRRTVTAPPYVSTLLPRAELPDRDADADAADYEKTMVLRRTPPPQSRAAAPGAAAAASQQTQAAPATPANRAKKISDRVLVVDDNATVRHFMEVKLAPFGFGVDFAESGEEAIGLTGENEYTCIFLDVVLPGIDGFQVCKLIKSNKQAIKRTAIVMLTGRTSTFDKMRGTLAGCDEYLTKPVDENRLLEVMAKFLPLPAAATV